MLRRIAEIDKKLIELLNQRASLYLSLEHERSAGLERLSAESFEALIKKSPGPLSATALRSVYREIELATMALQKTASVVYLGPPATFTHEAAMLRFGPQANYLAADSIEDVFEEIERGRGDYGVVPVENSTEGMVHQALDMLVVVDATICGEIFLKISHHLSSKSDSIDEIKRVYSHPQAIAQCRLWLAKNLPGVELLEASSTGAAAKLCSEDSSFAAIAGERAAEAYGLKIIKRSIEDNPLNYTRFLIIGKEKAAVSGRDKTSILLSLKHKAGALHHVLEPFAKNGINLTNIESRPMRKKPWEYLFFIDIEGHQSDAKVKRALKSAQSRCVFLKILGSYPRSETP